MYVHYKVPGYHTSYIIPDTCIHPVPVLFDVLRVSLRVVEGSLETPLFYLSQLAVLKTGCTKYTRSVPTVYSTAVLGTLLLTFLVARFRQCHNSTVVELTESQSFTAFSPDRVLVCIACWQNFILPGLVDFFWYCVPYRRLCHATPPTLINLTNFSVETSGQG